MQDIYSLLIPVKNSDKFWLINTKSFIETALFSDKSLNDLSLIDSYFLPFVKCHCINHSENAMCIDYICSKVKIKVNQLLGYVLISNRVVSGQSYSFNVILCEPSLIEHLNQSGIAYSLYSLKDPNIPLLGPEVLSAVQTVVASCGTSANPICPFLPLDGIQHITLLNLLNKPETSELIKTLFKGKESIFQQTVYSEFISLCYPCCEMGVDKFQRFMMKQNMDQKRVSLYFRCFNTESASFLSFDKFLIGVTCMDFNTVHGGETGELRCRYIFLFYDEDRDGWLTGDDLRKMLVDINTKKERSIDDDTISMDLQEALSAFGMDSVDSKMDLETFLLVVGNLLFRGTSVLFRFDPEVSFSNRIYEGETLTIKQTHSNKFFFDKIDGRTKNNAEQWDYTLAIHSAKIQTEDTMSIRPIWDDIHNSEQLGEFGDRSNLTYQRMHSVNAFKTDSCPNEILQSLKYFRYPDKMNNKRKMSWGDISMEILAKYLNLLCEDLATIVSKEPRMVEIHSPVYVLGDIHGNFTSLSKFEDSLWRLGIGLTPGQFLFLGDYVDRGKYGIEVVAYLFAQKVLHPNQFHLLRGNHEVRNIQEQYTFKRECIDKFGDACGSLVWNSINVVFDLLPLAAVIDEKLFCVHGGIPRPSLVSLNHSELDPLCSLRTSINLIPSPLSDPEKNSPLAWEIMWSDPDREDKVALSNNDFLSSRPFDDVGFIKNNRRNTACCFNQAALEAFLSRYHFSHVIRAHEVQQIGFNIEHQAKLVTVFSSSDYCHNNNEAACVLVSNRKLRLIRIDVGE